MFLLKKVLTALLLPPVSPILLGIAGLLLLSRWRRTGLAMTWTALLSLLVLSLPFTAQSIARAVNVPAERSAARLGSGQAIVILGGGVRRETEEYGDTLSHWSLERVRYGAWLAHRYQLPVLVSAGAVYGGEAEAVLMARSLEEEFGVPVRWIEARSRDTYENARFSAPLLRAANISRVLLVTHDFHQRRSTMEFRAMGIDPIPTSITSGPRHIDSFVEQLPSIGALQRSSQNLRELLGMLAASLTR